MKTIFLKPVVIFYSAFVLAAASGKATSGKKVCPFAHLQNGKTSLRTAGQKAVFKCNAGFQLLGFANSTCVAGIWDPPIPACVKAGCGANVTIKNGIIYQKSHNGAVVYFRCEPGYYFRDFPAMYCNGSRWNSTNLKCEANWESSQTQCDFEAADLCGWTQSDSNNDSYVWQRHSGSTPSRIVGTGPLFDHTLGPGHEGHYMYIEASTGYTNDTAFLYSPVYSQKNSQNFCVYFWYHMFGATTGSLKVYIKPEGSHLDQLKPLFTKEGHQEDSWLLGFFLANETDQLFQIVFEGVHGHGYTSDIAIDDIKLINGSCSPQLTPRNLQTGEDIAQRSDTARSTGRHWLAGAVAGVVLVILLLLAACVAAAVVVVKRRRAWDEDNCEASPNDAYVRYMSHEEALVQDDSDSSDVPDVL